MRADVPRANPNTAFDIGHLHAADILFEYPQPRHLWQKAIRFLNVAGQRLLAAIRKEERISFREGIKPYSHVMLGLGSGLVIHADGESVAIEIAPDALRFGTNTASQFEVYRHRGLSTEECENIAAAATRYYSQRYSFFSYLDRSDSSGQGKARKKEDTKQFCSRLVAHSFRAVGVPLTALPDNKVLPLDLYRACQSDSWDDISAGFLQEQMRPEIAEALGTINVPGEGEIALSEFMNRSDELLLELAQLRKQSHEMHYYTISQILQTEALLAKFSAARFDHVKRIRVVPEALDDELALGVVRVLQQLETLLSLSYLPTIDLLVMKDSINGVGKEPNVSPYVGLPTPIAIREMQKMREVVNVYAYLLLAEIGLYTILAHYTPHKKFERFRSTRRDQAEKFLTALPSIKDIGSYKDEEEQFLWVENEGDRKTSRAIVKNIVAALEVIEILRKGSSRQGP